MGSVLEKRANVGRPIPTDLTATSSSGHDDPRANGQVGYGSVSLGRCLPLPLELRRYYLK